MNDEFVTEAIQNDRCLKAARLLERLEKELEAEIDRVGTRLVEENRELFAEQVNSKIRVKFNSSTVLASARDNLNLHRVNPDKPGKTQTLNISLRWVDPIEWGEEDVDGALCAACYKINRGNAADFDRVKRETINGDWDLEFGDDQYNNAPGLFYVPVETAAEIREGMEILAAHFAEFADCWGVDPDEITDTGG